MARSASMIVLLLALISIVSGAEKNAFKVVQTEYGAVRGKVQSTMYGSKPYYSYRGIPFAKPPLNELRYKVKHINGFECGKN